MFQRAHNGQWPLSTATALAVIVAIPLGLVLLAIIELGQLPGPLLRLFPKYSVWIPALGLRMTGHFGWQIAFQLAAAAFVWALDKWPAIRQRPLVNQLAIAGLALMITAKCYVDLVAHRPFLGYLPLIALYFTVALVLFFWLHSLRAGQQRLSNPIVRVIYRLLPITALVGFAASHVANSILYHDVYPTLHLSVIQLSYLLLHAGLSSGIRSAIAANRLSARGVLQIGLLATMVLTTGLGISLTDRAKRAIPTFKRYCLLGHSDALRANRVDKAAAPPTRQPIVAPDPEAESRFLRHAHLPELPPTFDLTRHNILLISIEATRFDATSIGAEKPGNTPHLQRFAAENFWFKNAFTASPHTLQVFASMFSMTIPSAVDITIKRLIWHGDISEQQTTVAEHLAENGWQTFFCIHNFRAFLTTSSKGLAQGFKTRRYFYTRGRGKKKIDPAIANCGIEQLNLVNEQDQRFFGWLFFESPHYPYTPHYPKRDSSTKRARYEQEVRYADEQIGRILDHLADTGLLDTTIVIIHGDHGEEFGEHGGKQHHSVYPEVARVPLVIHIPHLSGSAMPENTSLTYLFAWLFLHGPDQLKNAANAALTSDLGPLMRESDGAVVVERLGRKGAATAIYWQNYALIFQKRSAFFELYDLGRDPTAQENLVYTNPELNRMIMNKFEGYERVMRGIKRWRTIESVRKTRSAPAHPARPHRPRIRKPKSDPGPKSN